MTFRPIKLPELPTDHVRIMGSHKAMQAVSQEQLLELNRLLRGNRKDVRRAERMLKKLGVQAVLGEDLRAPNTVS